MNENIIKKIKELCDKDDKNSAATLAEIKKIVKNADYPDFSTIKDGDHFMYRGREWIRLGKEDGGILCIVAKVWKDTKFDKDGSNNWAKSSIRRDLYDHFLPELDKTKLLVHESDMIADNGDKRYGKCEDIVFLLSCDLYRKYREFVPLCPECMWTLTPWYIDDSGNGGSVRIFYPSGSLTNDDASYSYGVAPACIFIEES